MGFFENLKKSLVGTKEENRFKYELEFAESKLCHSASGYVATAYAQGLGVEQDIDKSLHWLKHSANMTYAGPDGDETANFWLFWWYYYGFPEWSKDTKIPESSKMKMRIPIDYAEALYWGERYMTCRKTNANEVHFLIARMYEKGASGVPANIKKALEIYRFIGCDDTNVRSKNLKLDNWPNTVFPDFDDADCRWSFARRKVWELETGRSAASAPESFLRAREWEHYPEESRPPKSLIKIFAIDFESFDSVGPDVRQFL
ncbi:hypothetical protein N9270_03715 [Akkermansiaceae bacterium]|nr:hypothetical protein [Akkermansiaceae bacterium]